MVLAFESCSCSYSGRSPVLVLESARRQGRDCAAKPDTDRKSSSRFCSTIEYEYRCTEYRCAEYEYDASDRKELRARFSGGMLAVGINDPNWPDWNPLPKARTTKCTGATGRAFRSVLTRLPLPRDFNRSPTEMEGHNLTPREMLELHDDPIHWEYPPGFEYDAEQKRFLEFADAFSAALRLNPRRETGICIQDASFHSQLLFTADGGRHHSMRFSNFGSFVTVNDDDELPSNILTTIRELADQFGYTYIPYCYLDADYSGKNPGVTGIDSWWIRYFDYV